MRINNVKSNKAIDILENTLRDRGQILDILLRDNSTRLRKYRHIIWATDSYSKLGRGYKARDPILKEQITGDHGELIQPRVAKSKEEQKYRTKDKAEVFTPLSVVKEMNMAINWASKNWPVTKDNWQDYIRENRLEITCGEAPFIASRYNPTSNTRAVIKLHNRVGFLDYKLQAVGQFTKTKKDWLKYAEIALKACYGYEWQGDNLLIARENILQTMDDFYRDKFKKDKLTDEQLEGFAEIISWNIWQMDGLKYVIPMSCKKTELKAEPVNPRQISLLPHEKPKKVYIECEGCRTGDNTKHTGAYAKIMDWEKGKPVRFVDIVNYRKKISKLP